jgi:cell division protein FtsZ
MEEMGKAMMGTGEANGDRRALDAAEAAIANPLLEDMSMKGAKGVLINITGGLDVTLFEVDEAATRIRAEVDADAHIIVGSAFDPNLDGTMRVSVVATGIDANSSQIAEPTVLNLANSGQRPAEQEVKVLELEETPIQQSFNTIEQLAEVDIGAEEADVLLETKVSPNETLLEEIDANTDALLVTVRTEMTELDTKLVSEIKDDLETTFQQETVVTQEATVPSAKRMGVTDAFIPPKPELVEAMEEKNQVDSLWFADGAKFEMPQNVTSTNSFEGLQKPSLFERVTRTGRAAIGFADNAGEMAETAVLSTPEIHDKKKEDEFIESIKSVSASTFKSDHNESARQNELVGLGPQPEPKQKETDTVDDMLDIPAFLRRQAN